jgi:coenzyme F420-0:L-glutamate ligase/coenzyme F420-1:gamma-L-glutamate ligase
MPPQPMTVFPVKAPVQDAPFDLHATLSDALHDADLPLQTGDVVAVSSKYAAISEGRVVSLADVVITEEGQAIAARYNMNAALAQLVLDEADFVFGGIGMGFLLTAKEGIISPNAGLDRSNIPSGQVVLFSQHPYATAEGIRDVLQAHYGVRLGVVLTDSWLMPGRLGTTGVALASAGFQPTQDERGKEDLFGNPMAVTVRGVADSITAAAQMVMGERAEATPFAVVRGADVELTDAPLGVSDVAIDWRYCIYVESLTTGLLGEDVVRAIAEAPPYAPPKPHREPVAGDD